MNKALLKYISWVQKKIKTLRLLFQKRVLKPSELLSYFPNTSRFYHLKQCSWSYARLFFPYVQQAGLDCACGELIGWLWFAIGWSHASDRLPRPRHQRSRKWEGKIFWFKMCTDNQFITKTAIFHKKYRFHEVKFAKYFSVFNSKCCL